MEEGKSGRVSKTKYIEVYQVSSRRETTTHTIVLTETRDGIRENGIRVRSFDMVRRDPCYYSSIFNNMGLCFVRSIMASTITSLGPIYKFRCTCYVVGVGVVV